MSEAVLNALRDLIQQDVGKRGLMADPHANLINACADDFAAACRGIAGTAQAKLLVVTGFHIFHGQPPASETDGPLGALFLARALVPVGVEVYIATDGSAIPALHAGLEMCGLADQVRIIPLPGDAWDEQGYREWVLAHTDRAAAPLTHLIALERVGPSHSLGSLQNQPALASIPESHRRSDPSSVEGADRQVFVSLPEVLRKSRSLNSQQLLALCKIVEEFERDVPPEARNKCHSMRGIDITAHTSPAHLLFEDASRQEPPITTIGIGDGGNEIGMGKIAWDVIRRNIPNGARIACRVPTDHLIVTGVSNWGAYGLAAGVRLLRGVQHDPLLFAVDWERQLLQTMVNVGPLVDGVAGTRAVSVDGLAFETYADVLRKINDLLAPAGGSGSAS